MQLTIDIKESALDKVMYLLENLKQDVRILKKEKLSVIEQVSNEEQKDLESILDSMTEDDKQISHSKTLQISIIDE
jgi:hypothetical protein